MIGIKRIYRCLTLVSSLQQNYNLQEHVEHPTNSIPEHCPTTGNARSSFEAWYITHPLLAFIQEIQEALNQEIRSTIYGACGDHKFIVNITDQIIVNNFKQLIKERVAVLRNAI
jgi:hypothetical protein